MALGCDMTRDVLYLRVPALGVHAESFVAPSSRYLIEARLDDREPYAVGHLFEPELDERRRLGRVVAVRLDGVRVPPEREEFLFIHPLDRYLHGHVFVPRIRNLS